MIKKISAACYLENNKNQFDDDFSCVGTDRVNVGQKKELFREQPVLYDQDLH